MTTTVGHAINDYLAPEQPDDCRQASLAVVTAALKATGPVAHRGRVVSLGKDGAVAVEDRHYERIPAERTEDPDGNVTEIPARDPDDAELAAQWGLPLASATPLPAAPAPTPASTTSTEN